ncbi:PKD-like family lipoprotein [Carboxylicivirga sp. M1479]|uniref:PKD-like family lipoprotein n=1 Tax=Carboxylicivirga sp. M1479 TaxID=2594476 RepID=UPI001177E6B5|nr:PKD-like family lipoprotein [Carboxylicivirga sp. M1479]TRX63309.1 hypothetical protein FNN09_18840 [Carboxylicivirga sp. M1479]
MTSIKYIKHTLRLMMFVLGTTVLFTACFKDDTTLADKEIPLIEVDADKTEFNIGIGDYVTIDPQATQSFGDQELNYEWALIEDEELEVISEEPVLNYQFIRLGSHHIRLKVTNNDGGIIQDYSVNVITPYQEGIIVLSTNEQGQSDLSFLKTLTPEEEAEGVVPSFETGVFSRINTNYTLSKAVDMDFTEERISISTQDNGSMWMLDSRTLTVISEEAFMNEIPGFSPLKMVGRQNIREGQIGYRQWDDNYVLSADGRVYGYSAGLNEVFESVRLNNQVNYSIVHGYEYNIYFGQDKEPYYSNRLYAVDIENDIVYYMGDAGYVGYNNSGPLFVNASIDIINILCKETSSTDGALYVIGKGKEANSNQVFVVLLQPNNMSRATGYYTYEQAEDLSITQATDLKYNLKYNRVYYFNGNRVYQWYATTNSNEPLPTIDESILELDAGLEITSMEYSEDYTLMYLGVNNPALGEMSGCVYVYDIQSMDLLNKYEGIAYKPVSVYYKTK